ncbi:hypothetical protein LTR66_008862 [Elasticomyces elasticus]|nr:hypothetical protein LTR66_008862 [Elasticomyces elasticus]
MSHLLALYAIEEVSEDDLVPSEDEEETHHPLHTSTSTSLTAPPPQHSLAPIEPHSQPHSPTPYATRTQAHLVALIRDFTTHREVRAEIAAWERERAEIERVIDAGQACEAADTKREEEGKEGEAEEEGKGEREGEGDGEEEAEAEEEDEEDTSDRARFVREMEAVVSEREQRESREQRDRARFVREMGQVSESEARDRGWRSRGDDDGGQPWRSRSWRTGVERAWISPRVDYCSRLPDLDAIDRDGFPDHEDREARRGRFGAPGHLPGCMQFVERLIYDRFVAGA